MDVANIVKFLEATSGPEFFSSDIQIVDQGGVVMIQSPPLPLRIIGWWMGFVFLVIVGLIAWLQPADLWWVLLMGPPAVTGFLVVMRLIERARVKAGPQATIGRDIVNFAGATMVRTAAKGLLEVFFNVHGNRGNRFNHYRVVFVHDGIRHLPILWQIGGRSRWTRPALEDLAGRLGIPAESMDLPDTISPPPTANW